MIVIYGIRMNGVCKLLISNLDKYISYLYDDVLCFCIY